MNDRSVEFDEHLYLEAIEEIKKRTGRDPSAQEMLEAASKAIQIKLHGKPIPIEGNDDRAYRSELVVFEALMNFQAKLTTGTYNTQERARIADTIAKDAGKKIREYWEREK